MLCSQVGYADKDIHPKEKVTLDAMSNNQEEWGGNDFGSCHTKRGEVMTKVLIRTQW